MPTEAIPVSGDELEGWRLLPWLANGSLEGEELDRALRYLRMSPAAREELLFLSELRYAVETASSDEFAPSEERLERLMRRIDEHEAEQDREGRRGRADGAVRSPTPSRWTSWRLAAVAALLLVAFLLVSVPFGWRARPAASDGGGAESSAAFRTLSEDRVPDGETPVDRAPRLRVVFEEGTNEADLRALLVGLRLEIVSGPSRSGVYSLRSTTSASAAVGSDLLDRLRQDRRVALAEFATDE